MINKMTPTNFRIIKPGSVFLLVITVSLLFSCKHNPKEISRNDFKKFYDTFRVDGSFILYDKNNDLYMYYNKPQSGRYFTPASTFKIFNSLVGLETGVIKDENFVISWDSVICPRQEWNTDHDLKTAFRNSTVWYYQELARRVGGNRMKTMLDKNGYGNMDTSGGIDRFWLDGGLRITPLQQVQFLEMLHDNRLDFSQKSMDIVKKIMIEKDTAGYILRAKTGWGNQDGREIGWYVGYLENNKNVYYFANCIQTSNPDNPDFARARKEIVFMILIELGVIKTNE